MKHRFSLVKSDFTYFHVFDCQHCRQTVLMPRIFINKSLLAPEKHDANHYEMLAASFPICTPI